LQIGFFHHREAVKIKRRDAETQSKTQRANFNHRGTEGFYIKISRNIEQLTITLSVPPK